MTRAILLSTAITFAFFIVLVRLGELMLLEHQELSAKAMSQYQRESHIKAGRGDIYDRRGRELAVSLDAQSLYCDPAQVASVRQDAMEIAKAVGVSYSEVEDKMSVTGKKHFIWIKRKLSEDQSDALKGMKLGPGIGFVDESKRYYPEGSLAAQVLGYLNMDSKAQAGVEKEYSGTLTDKGGKVVVERDATGKILSQGVQMESRGDNVVLTIDEGLQFIAESALDEAMQKWKAESAVVIMMDPYTGGILAMSSRPTFNPNDPGAAEAAARRNRAIMDVYEPGSVFKIVMGSAGLETGTVTPQSVFNCYGGRFSVGGRTFHDVEKNGILTFEQIIQKSSNVGSIQVALKLGPERLYKYARLLGFGQKTDIDLPSETGGYAKLPHSDVSLASMAIGYGVAVTPLQILRAYSAIANGGYLVSPHVVSRITSPDGQTISSFHGQIQRVLKPETAAIFRKILGMVTQKGGTAEQAAVDGNAVCGKTGTARLFDPRTGRYSDKYASTFVGFVPAKDPKIAMIVVFKGPKGSIYGGVVSGPVFSTIAEKAFAYLNVPRDDADQGNIVYVGKGKDSHGVVYTP
ncbi:MAG: penicillin-binding protein 2 [Nitrospiraceae bacterium]|nr:penicillin-binding protein 2 [Nitrospiraceae bacterium]